MSHSYRLICIQKSLIQSIIQIWQIALEIQEEEKKKKPNKTHTQFVFLWFLNDNLRKFFISILCTWFENTQLMTNRIKWINVENVSVKQNNIVHWIRHILLINLYRNDIYIEISWRQFHTMNIFTLIFIFSQSSDQFILDHFVVNLLES